MKNQNITFTTIVLALGAFAFLPPMLAVSPPPDGCYPGLTTAEGCNALFSLTAGQGNTALGHDALFSDTEGSWNTGVGAVALGFNNGDFNTAVGVAAMLLNNTGDDNTALGAAALLFNNSGQANTATGASALYNNTEGDFNTATGFFALYDNNGTGNTANGASALQHNTTGSLNTAVGGNALLSNTEGTENTATGANALASNTQGFNNTAIGSSALASNIGSGGLNGFDNTAIGVSSMSSNTTGYENTAIGVDSLSINIDGDGNTAIGRGALEGNTTGSGNTGLGDAAGFHVSTANNVICIGTGGANVSNSCYIGNIWQQPGGMQAVYVDLDGKLGAQVSSRRFKKDIKPMEQSSEAIYQLKPVSFRYKREIESTALPGFGLIAEDVDAANPDLVLRDKDGEPYTVRYDAVNAMLLNEFLKEHRKVQELESRVSQQEKQIESLSVGLQKVSAQLETNRSVQQVATNDR